jgi:hypothetical protein
MAFTKLEIQVKDLQKNDIFRVISSVGNFSETVEYEVVGAITVESNPHPSFPDLILHTAILKVKNRRTGKVKTTKYKADAVFTAWRVL